MGGHMVRVGNSAHVGSHGVEQCMLDDSTVRVVGDVSYRELSSQCCNMAGTTGTRMDPSCYQTINFAQAEQRCAAAGKRLCTDAEVAANLGAGSGCSHDYRHVWTSTVCSLNYLTSSEVQSATVNSWTMRWMAIRVTN